MKLDDHEIWQDERAARLRERDRHREPVRLPSVRPHAGPPPRTLRLACPTCNGLVFASSDSDRERVECTEPSCRASLVTRLQLDGSIDLVPLEVSP